MTETDHNRSKSAALVSTWLCLCGADNKNDDDACDECGQARSKEDDVRISYTYCRSLILILAWFNFISRLLPCYSRLILLSQVSLFPIRRSPMTLLYLLQ